MKNLLAALFVCICLMPSILRAQCNEFYDIHEGSTWEMETYNAKGKLGTKNQQKVTAFAKTSSGFTSTINSTILNEKGKELSKGDLEVKCENGTVYLDMRNYLNPEQMKAFSGYEMKIESVSLETPSKLSVGQQLKDGSITITAVGAPMAMKMTVNVTNRKVLAEEAITTPAGTFKCYKISSDFTMQNQMGINITLKFSSIEWIAAKAGTVKSESYDKNGKLTGYTLLTKRS